MKIRNYIVALAIVAGTTNCTTPDPIYKRIDGEVSKITSEFFSTELQSANKGEYYLAIKKDLSDQDGNLIRFEDKDHLLSYMEKSGYGISSEEELRFGWAFTFKKK